MNCAVQMAFQAYENDAMGFVTGFEGWVCVHFKHEFIRKIKPREMKISGLNHFHPVLAVIEILRHNFVTPHAAGAECDDKPSHSGLFPSQTAHRREMTW